eukprot:2287470-Amphidinium_carterae.1
MTLTWDRVNDSIGLSVPDCFADVEADEVTFAKRAVDDGVSWIQYIGLVRRGTPDTLIMHKLPERTTASRAPSAGPLLLTDWLPIADRFLAGSWC